MGTPSDRTFLHDLSNPLAIAQGHLEGVLMELKAGQPLSPRHVTKLEKALDGMFRIRDLIKAQRASVTTSDQHGSGEGKHES